MILVIGEILFDVFPKYKRLGGAPFNFAYHLKNLNFPVRFISRIGTDAAGKAILHKLKKYQFDFGDIQIDDVHPTGTVNVQLNGHGVPQFDIIRNVAYDYIKFIPEVHSDLISSAQMIYFGSIVQRTKEGYKNLQDMIGRKSPEALIFYDINLRPNCYNETLVKESLLKTNILKLNQAELGELKQWMSFKESRDDFIGRLMDAYSLDIVSLTMGETGSALFTRQGRFNWDKVNGARVIDSVGAGDAYAAMLAAGLLKGWQPEEILRKASIFATRVCEIKGAIPESASFYEPLKPLFGNG